MICKKELKKILTELPEFLGVYFEELVFGPF